MAVRKGPSVADGELSWRLYLAQWSAWWAGALTILLTLQVVGFLSLPQFRNVVSGHMGVLIGALFLQVFVAALFGFAGYLIRCRLRSGVLLALGMFGWEVVGGVSTIARSHRHLPLDIVILSAWVLGAILIARAWPELFKPASALTH
ncbi:MAG TPA: hypothetical protein VGM67_18215 [Gemmatimonadaceae bacterium]|jgi:hypothetical protein